MLFNLAVNWMEIVNMPQFLSLIVYHSCLRVFDPCLKVLSLSKFLIPKSLSFSENLLSLRISYPCLIFPSILSVFHPCLQVYHPSKSFPFLYTSFLSLSKLSHPSKSFLSLSTSVASLLRVSYPCLRNFHPFTPFFMTI